MSPIDYHRPHLLIVDDTPTNISILLDALESDYEVAFSTSGEEALRLIAESEIPDLILLDVMMPEMDGYEVCRRLKQNPVTRDIPIIFVTALNSQESESIGLALGADDYIAKPINLDISRLRIKNVLQRTRLGRELELTLACANQGLWEWDLKSDTVKLDSRWATPMGYAPDELDGHTFVWDKILHPDDVVKFRQVAKEHLNEEAGEISVEIRMRTKNSDFRWVQVLGKGTSRDLKGYPMRVIGTCMDITRRKADELAIEAHKNRLVTLIDFIPDSVLAFDANGVLSDLHIAKSQAFLQLERNWAKRAYGEIFPKELAFALTDGMIAAKTGAASQTQEFYIEINNQLHYYTVLVGRLGEGASGEHTEFLAVIRDITQTKLIEEELKQQALHDPLTELPNRRILFDRLRQAQLNSSRSNSFAALFLLDLNKFKQINDTHGHEIGDKLLIEVASRLLKILRNKDTVVRLGGDEFVVLIENLGVVENEANENAKLVAGKLSETLCDEYHFGDLHLHCSVSIGAKLFQGEGIPVEEILEAADKAMYRMKGNNDS